jgi:hypothetical protein
MAGEIYFCRRCQKPSFSPICADCGLTAAPMDGAEEESWPAATPAGAPAVAPAAAPSPPPILPPLPLPPPSFDLPPPVDRPPVVRRPEPTASSSPALLSPPPSQPPPVASFASPVTSFAPPSPSFAPSATPPPPSFAPPSFAPPATPRTAPPAAAFAPKAMPTGLAASPEAAQVADYLADGFQIFLVAGIEGTGKTHLMETFRGQDQLDRVQDVDGFLMPTRPTGFELHPFPHGKRKAIFVDTSGERYRKLYAVADRAEDKPEIQLLQVVSQGLGGLILLLKLQDLWDPASEGGKQPRVLTNILRLLRWLRGGGTIDGVRQEGTRPDAAQRGLAQRVDAEVERMPPLKVPVLLLVSQADRLHGHLLPSPKNAPWLEPSPGRKVYPAGEDPLLLLHHYAPEVLAALEKHVHHFHVDFCHSVVTDPESGKVVADQSCGVALAREWLLEASERPPLLPSRFWLQLDRRLRAARWAGLPPSRPLGEKE